MLRLEAKDRNIFKEQTILMKIYYLNLNYNFNF